MTDIELLNASLTGDHFGTAAYERAISCDEDRSLATVIAPIVDVEARRWSALLDASGRAPVAARFLPGA